VIRVMRQDRIQKSHRRQVATNQQASNPKAAAL
jgi:hypothetical protein